MINSIDFKIVARLMSQGRTTWTELGTMLGLSAPAAADRVRRLEEKGIIKGYHAAVDPDSVGIGMAALIAVSLSSAAARERFLSQVRTLPEVLECHHVAGDDDYVLKVRCRDTRELEQLISCTLKSISGVCRTRTTVILSTIKETSLLPLAPAGD
ncbi:MAG: Lrp/AsnC family transcriptional regulator [Veillonellaceae bacterium]|jgi:Lrp/AsnC family leucine-responsive transcriptional regulator|nr:Lrp/AsnC family transcriptional regulator [Veillonellaceae bacterium]